VVVIAQEEWRRRFDGDPAILGRTVRLGSTEHTVVGVMPEGFRFPINDRYWTPLRLDPTAHDVGGGPAIMVFGRLTDDVELERAQAELTTIGLRRSAASPDTHEHLRPRVLPYTHAFVGIDGPARGWLVRTVQVVLSLLLVVVAVNVAVLVYARTAARMGEIAVRSALGASRRRVVTQLFAEALVLSLVAALIGLTLVRIGFDRFLGLIGQENVLGLPFWVDFGFSPAVVAYVAGLVVLAGVIVGVIPALKATGSAINSGLQQLRGGSHLRLGRAWNALIVVQVAIAVAVLPYALFVAGPSIGRGVAEPDYPVEQFLRASLSLEDEGAGASRDGATPESDAFRSRFLASSAELLRRLEAEPALSGVTFATLFPGSEEVTRIEVEGSRTRTSVWMNRVGTDLFTVFDVPILAGRSFTGSDAGGESNAVVVDRIFAEQVLGGGDVLGRRVRLLTPSEDGATDEVAAGPWLEIVGVVPEFTVPPAFQAEAPKLFRPLALADAPDAVQLAVRARPDAVPAAFVARLREIAEAVDPALRLDRLETASQAERERQQGLLFLAILVVSVTGSVLLLSAAGIYAMMSFTVASRRREIGIRSALGAAPGRVLTGIFKRASAQLGAGVLGGLLLAEGVIRLSGGTFLGGEGVFLLPTVAALMVSIGLLAALGPARRGLAVQPTEALREE
jgi:predicted permease